MAISSPSALFNGGGGISRDTAHLLLQYNMDPGVMRPWQDVDGKNYMTVNSYNPSTGRFEPQVITLNAPSLLRRDEWMAIDTAVIEAAKPRLRLLGDLVNQGLTYNIPDGMAVTVLQHRTMLESGEATISMSPLRKAERDRPTYDIGGLPLPIIHEDFSFDLREINVSRRMGLPVDTQQARTASRKVMEAAEKLASGVLSSYSYAGYTVYGLTNFPDRLTKTLTLPTAAGWTPDVTVTEVNAMIQQLQDINRYGPFGVYFSPAWTQYLNGDYSAAQPSTGTLMSRLRLIENISFWRTLDYLGSGFQIVLFQLDGDVIRLVQGMPLTTVQWESHGGFQLNFKVFCIMVPQLRSDANSETGIVHGVAA